jgi:hypothetical protein
MMESFNDITGLLNSETGGKVVVVILIVYVASLLLLHVYARFYKSELFTTISAFSIILFLFGGIIGAAFFYNLSYSGILICILISMVAWIPALFSSFRRRTVRQLYYTLYSPIIGKLKLLKTADAFCVFIVSIFIVSLFFSTKVDVSGMQESQVAAAVAIISDEPTEAPFISDVTASPEPTPTDNIAYGEIIPLEFNVESIFLNLGESISLANSINKNDTGSIKWSSVDDSIATVDEDGNVTAVSLGAVVITAESANGDAECVVTVRKWIEGKNVPYWVEGAYEQVWVDEQTIENVIPGYYENYTVPGYYREEVVVEGRYQDIWVEGHYENETVIPGHYETIWIDGYYYEDETDWLVWVEGRYETRWVDEIIIGDWFPAHMEQQWIPEETAQIWVPEETRRRWVEERIETKVIEGHYEEQFTEGYYEDKWVEGHWVYE